MLTLAIGGNLHLAPIGPNPQNVLDIATGRSRKISRVARSDLSSGTGIWAIEFGKC